MPIVVSFVGHVALPAAGAVMEDVVKPDGTGEEFLLRVVGIWVRPEPAAGQEVGFCVTTKSKPCYRPFTAVTRVQIPSGTPTKQKT
jgi:hypothetical protein